MIKNTKKILPHRQLILSVLLTLSCSTINSNEFEAESNQQVNQGVNQNTQVLDNTQNQQNTNGSNFEQNLAQSLDANENPFLEPQNNQFESQNNQFESQKSSPPEETAELQRPDEAQNPAPLIIEPVAGGPTQLPNGWSGAPPLSNARRMLAPEEAPTEYIVQYGDTLFDIGKQLLGDGGYWPKLWQINPYLKNPHFIYPGMRIRFYPGTDDAPPFIEVTANDQSIPLIADEQITAKDVIENVAIPSIPKNFLKSPQVISSKQLEITNPNLFSYIGSPIIDHKVLVQLAGHVLAEPVTNFCTITATNNGRTLSWKGKKVMCIPNQEVTVPLNRPLSVLRPVRGVFEENEQYPRHAYYHIATVVMKSPKLGHVSNTIQGVEQGDLIVPYIASNLRIVPLSEPSNAKETAEPARIIALGDPGRFLAQAKSFIFLDQGISAGFHPGRIVSIYRGTMEAIGESLGHISTLSDKHERRVGVAEIVQASKFGSVAYIHWANDVIYRGDDAGVPTLEEQAES